MIPFSPPRIDQEVINEVVAALKSGWVTTGPRTKQFEIELAAYAAIEKVLAVNSWTAGAEMLLRWFGIQPGDEVIVPSYTYCATANIVIHCGATPIMVDVDEDFCINIDALGKAITSKTKAIITVDLGGYPVDYSRVLELIDLSSSQLIFHPSNETQNKLNRILFISDAAHSFGASYNGKKVGSQADFTVFSFHAVKNLTTAEGGAICINLPKPFCNQQIYEELNTLSLHGQNKDALAKSQKGAWEYDVLSAGFKCNMTDILASIGLVELRRYENDTLIKRKKIVRLYNEAFSNLNWAITPPSSNDLKESSFHLYLLRITGIDIDIRNKIIQSIFDKGVSVNVHYKPLPELTFYKNLGYDINKFPVSKKLWESEISLPIFYDLIEEQIEVITKAVIDSYEEVVKC